MYKKIYRKIKKYQTIVIARHVGPDPDCIGSSIALKEIILNKFPKKNVYVIGASSSKFRYLGFSDKMQDEYYENSLLIVVDTPDFNRIDGVDATRFNDVIKIDHHPFIEKIGEIEWIDEESSSACQMILELTENTRLKLTKSAAEKLFIGLVSDTNRFLFKYTSPKTYRLVAKILEEFDLDFSKLYEHLYLRPLHEVKLQGYIEQNLVLTENNVAYIKLTQEIINEFGGDFGSVGNLVNNLNYIEEVLVWVTFTDDPNIKLVKAAARSRGPEINKALEHYNGGGHKFASGARLQNFEECDLLINELDELCKEYKQNN